MTAQPLEVWDGRPVRALAAAWGVPVLEAYGMIGSTSDRAAELIGPDETGRHAARAPGTDLGVATEPASGVAQPVPSVVVVADAQSRGRGRRGATWHSAPGCGLWMSAVLPGRWAEAPWLPLVVGLAVAEAIEAAAPAVEVGLVWPNDLHLRGGKVGGVLCEARPGGVVAGVGVNLRTPPGGFPAEIEASATSLETEHAMSLMRSELAGSILERFEAFFTRVEPRLTPTWRDALADRDRLAGRAVETEQAGVGVAAGLDEDGALLLEQAGGRRVRVVAGSVRLRS